MPTGLRASRPDPAARTADACAHLPVGGRGTLDSKSKSKNPSPPRQEQLAIQKGKEGIAPLKIALSAGVNQSTLSRELGRNKTGSGKHLWNEAHGMAMTRRRRITGNSRKDSVVVWDALEHVRRDDRSPKQVAGYMKREDRPVSHGLTCQYVRTDESGKPEVITATA